MLDVVCRHSSITSIYDNFVGYDADPRAIKSLRNGGYKGVVGDYRNLPFEDNTFDISVSF